ncbi:hypothetical protein BKA70DRAFT_8104 [Coprinopsis sp. MPI-PUGE-AT-0042]|nr:hypothetical protein BKA70DRAFT_8104 [Coprinopsis sp. MPI-PUGE-AT-0042]
MRFSLTAPLLLLLAADAAQAGTVIDIIDSLLGRALKPEALAKDITAKGLMGNLAEFQKIATANGGNRAFGLPGFRASADYVLAEVKKLKRTIDVREQEFTALFAQTEEIQFNEVGKDPLYVFGLTYSPSTSDEGITAPLALGPAGLPGCDASGYTEDVTDKIVLVQRFRCPDSTTLAGRVRAAVKAGAAAVIIYNDIPTKPTAGTLSAPDPVGYRPAGFISQADGQALATRLSAGEEINVFFKQKQTIEDRQTWNIIAETKGGDKNNVIVIGGHLDSVQAGPGINDDGSGSTVVLEIVKAVSKYAIPDLKLRFAFWGAEENGLLGSKYYVRTLPAAELANVRAYLNFDMVSKGFYGVFDGDGSALNVTGPAGSDVIEDLFVKYLEGVQKVTTVPAGFTGGSDYVSFMERGIPVGGLFTGTGINEDPCYHQECDTYDNPNPAQLEKNGKAAAHVLAVLAKDGKKLIPKWTPPATAEARIAKIEWTKVEGDKHVHFEGGCGGSTEL